MITTSLLRRWAFLSFLCMAGWLSMGSQAQAQSCYSSSFGIAFGTVSNSSNTDVTAAAPFNCQSNANTTYFRACLMIGAGTDADINGLNPRRMKNYIGSYVDYNLYSNAARTQIIGPPPTGSGYTLYTMDFVVPGGFQAPLQTFNVYGRVPPVPAGTAAGGYQAQIASIVVRYSWSNSATPPDCYQAQGGTTNIGYNGTSATVSTACSIAIGQATDLDFGSAASLSTAIVNTSTINLSCPNNVSWKMGLSDGQNAVVAGQRRMAGPSTDFVAYELYRDTGRTLRWGNDTAGGTNTVNGTGSAQTNPTVLNVYGRVPVQSSVTPGNYLDIITVNLTY